MKVKIEILKDGEHYSETEFYYVTEDELDEQVNIVKLEARSEIVSSGIMEYNTRPLSTEALNPFMVHKGYPGNPRTIVITDDCEFVSYVKHLLKTKIEVVTKIMDENE